MVGSAVCRFLDKKKIKYIKCSRKKLDLTNQEAVNKYFKKYRPNVIINCAGRVGGILENSLKKDKFINEIPGNENGYIEYLRPFLKLIKTEKELFKNN